MSVSLSVCLCVFLNVLLHPFKNVASPIGPLPKDSLGKYEERTLVSDFVILGKKLSNIAAQLFFVVVGLCHSLLMDLGHNQWQHLTVHSGGVSRVPCRSSAPPLPLTFRSPSSHLPLPFRFLWTLFFDTFCEHCFWNFLAPPSQKNSWTPPPQEKIYI